MNERTFVDMKSLVELQETNYLRLMSTVGKRALATEARRLHILEAAAACFVEKGFHQTSMRDIASAAGVSLGNLYNHFESKAELIGEFAKSEEGDLHDLISKFSGFSDPLKAISKFSDSYLTMCLRPGALELTIDVISEGLRNPRVAELFDQNRKQLVAALIDVIRMLPNANGSHNALNHKAETMLDIVEGMAIRASFTRRNLSSSDKKRLASSLISVATQSD
ncbi:MAG: TetR/AcrR family transcriptional regulator [Pelagimonas sp.]|jgi:AcrR family transcriptional regulator|uniref:TetR/AcrR family transcriptional regulator n=1 Tax=Pelagimonas sp. TaxID=2073170 RepID=UPI003C9C403D|nr:helix-turn-helix domain containing protein [Roseovarius sp.]